MDRSGRPCGRLKGECFPFEDNPGLVGILRVHPPEPVVPAGEMSCKVTQRRQPIIWVSSWEKVERLSIEVYRMQRPIARLFNDISRSGYPRGQRSNASR